MTVKVIQSVLSNGAKEEKVCAIADYEGPLSGLFEGADYASKAVQPVVVFVNGEQVPHSEWDSTVVSNADRVEIYVKQFGFVGKILGKVFNFLFGWLMPKTGSNRMRDPGQGKQLLTSEAKANTARPNQTVAETFGNMLVYPAYLTQTRRVFTAPRDQDMYMLLCVGPGSYQVDGSKVRIGNTPFNDLTGAEFQLHQPGANLSSVIAAQNWYNAPEIGGTSGGTAGLDLSAPADTAVNPTATSYDFSGNTITANAPFPESWASGFTVMAITVMQTVAVERIFVGGGDAYFYLTFTADWSEIAPTVGLVLNARGAVESQVRVSAVNGSAIQLEKYDGTNWIPIVLPTGSYQISLSRGGRTYTLTSKSGNTITVGLTGGGAWAGFPTLTNTKTQLTWSVQPGTVIGETIGPFALCPSSEKSSRYEIDLFFPQGLYTMDDEANVLGRTVRTIIEWRDSANPSDPWTSVSKTYTAATLNQIGYTEVITTPSAIRAEFKVSRVGARTTSSRAADIMQWYGGRALLKTPTSYPWTTLSVKVRGLGKIAANSENQVNLEVTRILPTLLSNGTWSAPTPTRDISAALWYICQTIGYGVDNVDMTELLRLHNIWAARGETFDATLDETTVQQAIEAVFASGMSDLTLADGKIRPVREGVRTLGLESQVYSAQNTTKAISRQFTAHHEGDHDGVEVEYQDSTDGWAVDTVKCVLPGSLGVRLEKIKLQGVTSCTRAWRIGMRMAREQRYQRWAYTFSTELDALNSSYGDFVALVGDQSAIMYQIYQRGAATVIVSSEPLRWKTGSSHVVAFRRPDGSLAGPFPATQGNTEYELRTNIPESEWPTINLKQEPPHIYFGPEDAWQWPALIRNVRPSANNACSVQAVNYDARIYADDDNQPPPKD